MSPPIRPRPSARSAAGRSSSVAASPSASRAAAVRAGSAKVSAVRATVDDKEVVPAKKVVPPAKTASARVSSVRSAEAKQPSGRRVAPVEEGGAPARHSERARAQPKNGSRTPLFIAGGLIVVASLVVIGVLAWGPFQRSRQLAAIDVCRDTGSLDQGRQLAFAFAQEWGPRSGIVEAAITGGRGSVEVRVDWCRVGGHLHLLLPLFEGSQITAAQRGLMCSALAELWNPDDSTVTLPKLLPMWALDPASEDVLAAPALKLMVVAAGSETAGQLALALVKSQLSAERLAAVTVALCAVVEQQGQGVIALLTALNGPQRATLLGSEAYIQCVHANAQPKDAANLLALLAKPDSQVIAFTGLSGKRFVVSESDAAARALLTAQLLPFLSATTPDAALSGALMVCHRQQLLGARAAVIALLPRLGKNPPAQISADDVADLLGKSLVNTKTPEAARAAEEMVLALTAAVGKPDSEAVAIRALSRVQYQNIVALRPALDMLAGHGPEGANALVVLVGKVYSREDIVKTAEIRGWKTVLAEDKSKRARFEAITQWLSAHAEETNARVASSVLAANKAELGRQRDELNAWIASGHPLPIGITKRDLEQLSDNVRAILSSVIKATHE